MPGSASSCSARRRVQVDRPDRSGATRRGSASRARLDARRGSSRDGTRTWSPSARVAARLSSRLGPHRVDARPVATGGRDQVADARRRPAAGRRRARSTAPTISTTTIPARPPAAGATGSQPPAQPMRPAGRRRRPTTAAATPRRTPGRRRRSPQRRPPRPRRRGAGPSGVGRRAAPAVGGRPQRRRPAASSSTRQGGRVRIHGSTSPAGWTGGDAGQDATSRHVGGTSDAARRRGRLYRVADYLRLIRDRSGLGLGARYQGLGL